MTRSRKKPESAATLLRDIVEYFDDYLGGGRWPDGPLHKHHALSGRWDDNGSKCKWCALWNRARKFVKKGNDHETETHIRS